MQVCTSTPLPSFNDLYTQFAPNLTYPPFHFTLPSMPTLPSPMFPTTLIPNLQSVIAIGELQATQIMNTIMGMLTPITNYLGQTLSSIIPTVPVLNIALPDLLSGSPGNLVAQVQAKLAAGITFPGIPTPLFPDIGFPDLSAIMTTVNLIRSYITALPSFIFGLIGQVTSKLKIGAMPAIPTMPTMAQLQSMVVANLPPIPNVPNPQSYLDALQAKIPANLAFNFTVPGFPAIPALPSPLLPDINFPEFDFHVGLGNMLNSLSTYNLQQCVNFCQNSIGQLGFSFPTICVPFTPSV